MALEFDVKLEETAKAELKRIAAGMQGRPCYTNYLHLVYMLREQMGEGCRQYCEIGTLFGGSMILAMQSAFPCRFLGVDLFNFYGKPVDPISKTKCSVETTKRNIDKFNVHKHQYDLVKGSSHAPPVVQRVRKLMPQAQLLFIDGDHSKPGVLADWKMYSPMVESNGIAVFDNYNDPAWRGVTEAVKSIDFTGWTEVGEFGRSIIFRRQ